jgi:hypothetical protein
VFQFKNPADKGPTKVTLRRLAANANDIIGRCGNIFQSTIADVAPLPSE